MFAELTGQLNSQNNFLKIKTPNSIARSIGVRLSYYLPANGSFEKKANTQAAFNTALTLLAS